MAACAGGSRPVAKVPSPTDERGGPIDTTGMARVRFARGTTSGILDDSVTAGGTRSYVLGAEQGQVMLVHAIAWPVAERLHPPPEPRVRVFSAATGRELPSPKAEPAGWSSRLAETGDYVVRVTAVSATAYTLAVQIPRQVDGKVGAPPVLFTGTAPSRVPIDYLVAVEAGRTLEVTLGGAPSVALHVYGLGDGVQLARLADRQRLFAGRVETTQDYVVSVVPGAERAPYDLRIAVR